MPTILAAHFQLQEQVDEARHALMRAGFAPDQISSFFVNQPGQHDLTAIGGDRDESPGAKETPRGLTQGVAAGGALGAALGAATASVTGPVGPVLGALVGAHVGSLFSFSKMKEAGEPEEGSENEAAPRPSGMFVAVALPQASAQEGVIDIFRSLGAQHIERASGAIVDGDWIDFDPLSPPVLA